MTQATPVPHAAPLLLNEWSATLETRTGLKLNLRPANVDDEQRLIDFFDHVGSEDLRFRFLGGVRHVGHDLAQKLLGVDHTQTENFLVFDDATGTLIGTAVIAAEPSFDSAEVAVAIRSDYKHRGVGYTLLGYASEYAAGRGIKRLETIEYRDNHDAIALEREMGFQVSEYPGDPTLLQLTKDLAPAVKSLET